jgi:hypothetical protein
MQSTLQPSPSMSLPSSQSSPSSRAPLPQSSGSPLEEPLSLLSELLLSPLEESSSDDDPGADDDELGSLVEGPPVDPFYVVPPSVSALCGPELGSVQPAAVMMQRMNELAPAEFIRADRWTRRPM